MIIEVGKSLPDIDNLMKYLLCQLKVRNMSITKTLMIKLIFKVKKELGKDHELYSQLPYYWYFYGPFSQPISDSFNYFNYAVTYTSPNQVILKDEFQNDFEDDELISRFPEIEAVTKEILKNKTNFYNNIKKDIYKDYAPFDIMYPLKFDIFDIAYDSRSANQFDNEKFIKNMFKCEAKLPCESYYTRYNTLFSRFITNLDFINEENNFNKTWPFLREPIQELWKTFAKGVRVENKDSYYKYKQEAWNREYMNSLNELSITVNDTKNLLHFDNNLPDEEYTPNESKMINATIGGYLRG